MDLLGEGKKKPKKTKGQKIVLILLIISIVLCIVIGGILLYLSLQGKNKDYTFVINGRLVSTSRLGLYIDENNNKYISLRGIANELGYKYYNGKYRTEGEETSKGHIDNGTNIIQFFGDSKKIYKTKEDSNLDYEYYLLDNKIVKKEDSLYINMEDLDIALNLIVGFSQRNNQTIIQTGEYFIELNTEKFSGQGIQISNEKENIKGLAYGYIVISKDGKFGVIDLNGKELIGAKYNNITFCEYTKKFIVANTDKKIGIINDKGLAEIPLQYDEMKILNYDPLLYKVKKLDKYGVLREDGTTIGNIEYDEIAYPKDENNNVNYTCIIPEFESGIPKSIVVSKDHKYGLINLEDGREVLECNLDAIYSITDNEEVYYMVERNNITAYLEEYVKQLNKITVTIP